MKENEPRKAPEAHETHEGRDMLCADCHQKITGTPIEKNG